MPKRKKTDEENRLKLLERIQKAIKDSNCGLIATLDGDHNGAEICIEDENGYYTFITSKGIEKQPC